MKNNNSLIYSVFLVVGDFLSLVMAFVVAYILRVKVSDVPLSAQIKAFDYLETFLTILPFWILFFAMLGLYTSRVYERRFSEMSRLFVGSFIGILGVISYSYFVNIEIFPARLVVIYGFLLAFFLALAFRTVARGIRRELFSFGVGINNVLIVGDTQSTRSLIESLGNPKITGYKAVGIVGGIKHPLKQKADLPVFASFGEAIARLDGQQIHTIVQTELYAQSERNDEILTFAQENHVGYRFVPGNSELFVGNIDVELFHSIPMIAVHQTPLIGWGRVVKRLFDLFFGGIALIL
jgi:FlaA1/EpsC-like NDP-sugar epimerase